MTTSRQRLILLFLAMIAIAGNAMHITDSLWNKEFACAQDIIDTYTTVQKRISKNDKEKHILNACNYVWHSGEYMFKCRGKNEDITKLPKHAKELELDNETVAKFMTEHNVGRFADHYFTMQAMQRGCSFDESRDGVEMTVFFPIRSLNVNDYNKLNKIFTYRNDALHTAYLKKLSHLLPNSGCNKELLEIKPLIEKNVADSKLKSKVISQYEIFTAIMPGTKASNVTFKDDMGKTYSIDDFKGKVIVIDVWATWCSSCLKNMPKFMELIKEFENNKEIVFFTVSTDSDDLKEKWLAAIKKHNMGGMLNLTPDRSATAQFEEKYLVSSVPRYIVIGKDGNIVSAFAPKPGSGLKEMIMSSL